MVVKLDIGVDDKEKFEKILKMLEYKNNKIIYKEFNGREMLIMPRDSFVNIIKSSIEHVGIERTGAIMYGAGFRVGYQYAQFLCEYLKIKGEGVLGLFLRGASARGWGKWDVENYTAKKIVIRGENTIGEELKESKACVNWFDAGAMAGIIKYAFESAGKVKSVYAKETKCIAKGNKYCEIEVRVD